MKTKFIPAFIAAGLALPASAESFYRETPVFSTAPSEKQSVSTLTRFGPVGMALELHQPAFTMHAGNIEPGSPAETAGLQKGQIIETINGQALKDIDPRIQLGQLIEAAEATDGILKFVIRGQAEPVVVKIPVLGAYSPTWPLNCPKSDKIVRNFADHLAKPGSSKGFADIGMLFLLSTGEDKDLAPVREWVHSLKGKRNNGYAWHIGYGGLAICEYYLRTGDAEALPVIQQWVDAAAQGEYLNGWAGRGGVVRLGYGNGHLNAAGTHVVTFLLLAKQCGVNVDESLLNRTLTHFFRYAGRGLNPYGDDRPETSFVDNGKNGKLAFAMAAAASLTPEGEKSIYANARDHMANTSFYTTTFMLHGHTGGGIGEIWRSSAMGLLAEEKPKQHREFMDHRKWHYDMSRHNDGQFSILGGSGYDKPEWGTAYALTYTIPRKTLRITGAPPSKFSKTYALPARPWGTEADDIFVSLDPVPGVDLDISTETLAKDSSKPLIERLNEKELTDDEIRRYLHHPDYLIRNMVSLNAAGLSCDYMFPKPGHRVRPELLEEFASHPDPRVRNAGIRAAIKAFNPELDWSQRIFHLAIERLSDDAESWFVKDACLSLIQSATPDMIVPHADLLVSYLTHSEPWLQQGSLMALMNIVIDERTFKKVLPPVGNLLQTTPRQSTTGGAVFKLREILPQAPEQVRALALEVFGEAYVHYSGGSSWPGGQDLRGHQAETLERLAGTLAAVPGGYDVLYQLAKERRPHEPLPYSSIFLAAEPEQFGPELRDAIKPIIRDELIYQFIGQNRRKLLADVAPDTNRHATVTNSVDELVNLYQKIGVNEYDWKNFGPDLRNAEWQYLSFDPPETQKYDISPWRYRPVTVPSGMENWFAPEFDAAKAGWKKGLPPFGQYKGELRDNDTRNPWNIVPRTLWEKEVLLVRGTFDFPALKPGHLYRLRVDRGQGVGAGDGFQIFINGKELVESTQGLGRRAGDNLRGGWITSEFTSEFGGPVTLSAITFLRYGDRAIVQMPPVPQGMFRMWLEERKLPTLDETVLRKAATFVPMFTSAWQATIDPESSEPPDETTKFRYDGKFKSNPAVSGKWTTVAEVASLDAFDPAAKPNPGRAPVRTIEFRSDGTTDASRWIWSGDTLMDLENSVAHKITPKSIDGTDYLVIESGGFSPRHPAGWNTPLMVLKKP
ncbi:MAG: DUF6288 domain-containing protein [Luteolibacter sp.]